MAKIIIDTEMDGATFFQSLSGLNVNQLETISKKLNGVILQKKSKDKKFQEAALLSQHNQTILSKEKRQRHMFLLAQLENGKISEEDRQEFLKLATEEEELRNKRVKILIELAQLKGIPFTQLLNDLGLKIPGNA